MPRPHGIEVRIAPVALQQPVWWERVLKRLRYGRTDLRLQSSWNRAPHLTAKGTHLHLVRRHGPRNETPQSDWR